MLLITSPMLGITGGSQPLISFNYGANRPDRIRKTFFWVLALCVCFTSVMFLISRIMPQHFVRIFTDEPGVCEAGCVGDQSPYADDHSVKLSVCDRGRLTALGMTKISLSLSLTRKTLYFAATCLIPLIWTAQSAFYAEPFADGAAACLSCVTFFFIYRKYLRGAGRLGEIRL